MAKSRVTGIDELDAGAMAILIMHAVIDNS